MNKTLSQLLSEADSALVNVDLAIKRALNDGSVENLKDVGVKIAAYFSITRVEIPSHADVAAWDQRRADAHQVVKA